MRAPTPHIWLVRADVLWGLTLLAVMLVTLALFFWWLWRR